MLSGVRPDEGRTNGVEASSFSRSNPSKILRLRKTPLSLRFGPKGSLLRMTWRNLCQPLINKLLQRQRIFRGVATDIIIEVNVNILYVPGNHLFGPFAELRLVVAAAVFLRGAM